MNNLDEIFKKIPFTPLLVLYLGWLGYDYYQFEYDASSPMMIQKAEAVAKSAEIKSVELKIKQAKDFYKNLETKKAELRALAEQLNGMKSTLTEGFDVPTFMKLVVTEAKKIGLIVTGLKPTKETKKEYYTEQAFDLTFQGVYAQVLVFLDRLSQAQKIVRVDNFVIHPRAAAASRYTELDGTIEIKAFSYVGTRDDELNKASVPPAAGPAGAAVPPKASGT